jgi:hypothetical protein
MKTFLRVLPAIAVVAVLGGAIYYVTSTAPAPQGPPVADEAPVAQSNGAPASDRYSTGG